MKQLLNYTAISKIETNDTPIPSMKEMKFGETRETRTPVFNYTNYLRELNIIQDGYTNEDVHDILEKLTNECGFNIKNMLAMYNIQGNMVFFTDHENIYINSALVMIVASYHNPSMISEAFDYLKDIYTFGFALSDNVLYQQCAFNMPDEMLVSILQSRKSTNEA